MRRGGGNKPRRRRRGRFGRRNFARCAWRTRGWSGACGASAWLSRTRRDARRATRRTTSVSPHGARVQRKRRGRRGTGTTRGFGGETRGAKRRRSGGGCRRTRPGGVRTKTRDGDVRTTRDSIGSETASSSSPPFVRRVPSARIRTLTGSNAATGTAAVDAGRCFRTSTSRGKSRFQRLREENDREARLRLPLEAREKDHRRRRAKMYGEMVKELHRPRVSERARARVATRADAIRPGFEDLSRIAPPEPASRAADEYDINGRRVARDLVDAPRRDTSGPRPRANRCPRRGRVRSGQRARARGETTSRETRR